MSAPATSGMDIDFNLDRPPAPFQRWATEQLGLPPTATAAAARTLLRERLRNEDFVPPLRWQQAVQVLGEKRAPGQLPPATVLNDEERRLDEEVSEFAGKFFTLPVDERRVRWQELLDQALAQPLIQQRLRALEPGLTIVPQPVTGGPTCEELAEQVRELFTLHGTTKAVRQQAFLTRVQPRIAEDESAAQSLLARYPDLRSLEQSPPVLLGELARRTARQFVAHTERARAQADAGSYTPGMGVGGIATILIGIALGLVLGIARSSDRTSGASRPTLPTSLPRGHIFDRYRLHEQICAVMPEVVKLGRPDQAELERLNRVFPLRSTRVRITYNELEFLRSYLQDPNSADHPVGRPRFEKILEQLERDAAN